MLELVYATNNITRLIEKAGRVCYKSEDKITKNSDEKFIKAILGDGMDITKCHESVIEHSNIIIKLDLENGDYSLADDRVILYNLLFDIITMEGYKNCLKIRKDPDSENYYIAGNVRAYKDVIRLFDWDGRNYISDEPQPFIDNLLIILTQLPKCLFNDFYERGILVDIKEEHKYKFKDGFVTFVHKEKDIEDDVNTTELYNLDIVDEVPEKLREELLTATFKLEEKRSTSHQDVRARLESSYSHESQRYCDYSLDGRVKFRYQVPESLKTKVGEIPRVFNVELSDYLYGECNGELKALDKLRLSYHQMVDLTYAFYNSLRNGDIKPEDARDILPNCAESDIVVTRTLSSWRHWLTLRGDCHAQLPIRKQALVVLEILHKFDIFLDLEIDKENNVIIHK